MNIKISYQTLLLPPPFAHGYTLSLVFLEDRLQADYQLEYLNRDSITEEEILSEGFSTDDDFQWQGTLDKSWKAHLAPLFAHTPLVPETDEENTWIHFEVKNDHQIRSGIVKDATFWEYQLQELIQAIYETSGRERPLSFLLVHTAASGKKEYVLTGYFARRMAAVNGREKSWDFLKSVMEIIYSMDYEAEPRKHPAAESDWWIDPSGEGFFFSMKAMAGKDYQHLSKRLAQLFDS